jgi:hypothetical protein
MIRRTHRTLTDHSTAIFSDCERYRYVLQRRWAEGPKINFIMLNPSTADELANDPTVERCQRRAMRLGYAGLVVTNLFAWRATDPRDLRRTVAPDQEFGTTANDDAIEEQAAICSTIVCAWGTHGKLFGRAAAVLERLRKKFSGKLHALKLSNAGIPCHPLYLSYDLKPFRF